MSYSDTTPNLNLPQWTDQDKWDVADLTGAMLTLDGDPVVGSDANGQWVRWANGLQICTRVVPAGTVVTSALNSVILTFPKPFATKWWSGAGMSSVTAESMNDWEAIFIGSRTSDWVLRTQGATVTTAYNFYVMAIGLWK